MDYEQGLERLKQQAKGTNWLTEFSLYEARLRENLSRERRYGTTEIIRADRAQIVDQLNRLAYAHLSRSFVDLCLKTNQPALTTPSSQPTLPSSVFIGYSHRDGKYVEELRTHLTPYIRSGAIAYWDDTKILPGDHWRDKIEKALHSATIAVLLISADFLASEFIAMYELPLLIEAAQQRRLTILCVIVRPCLFHDTELEQFQAVNPPSQPLSTMSSSQREEVWIRVVELVKSRA